MRMGKQLTKIFAGILTGMLALQASAAVWAAESGAAGYTLAETKELADLGGTAYYYRHDKTGAEVVWLDNGAERREFSIGFKTPPADSKGANHVLEHSLLCGSEKYPTKNIMHYVRVSALAEEINAYTSDDCTYYSVKTTNETEYYNLMDIYLNGIFHPLLLRDQNIFRQQGVRLEYADGAVRYNGVVYNELRINSLESTQNSVDFLSDRLYRTLYGETAPAFDSGGTIEGLKSLTYEDLLRVYHTYYIPSNCMVFLAGQQDLQKTLRVLDSFFDGFEKQAPELSFPDTRQLPREAVQEFNVNAATQTVDVGFMSSGVPMSSDCSELYARDIIFNLISQKMGERYSKTFVSGGNSGGIANLALLVSEIPAGEKEAAVAAYRQILEEYSQNGFDQAELKQAVESYVSERQNPYVYATELSVFNGLLYRGDPFAFAAGSETGRYLLEHPEIFDTVLKKYFTENPYSVIVVSGNGAAQPEEDTVSVSETELEQIKKDTEAFQAWAEQADDPQVVASIPTLTLDEVKTPPAYGAPQKEEFGGLTFFCTRKTDAEPPAVSLFFPLAVETEDLQYAQLLVSFLNLQAQKSGLSGVYIDIWSGENYHDPETMNPQLLIGLSPAAETLPEDLLRQIMDFLRQDSTWSLADLTEYMVSALDEILQNGYRDPYYLSYDLMQSAQSAGKRLYSATRGSIGQGSPAYYHFLRNADSTNGGGYLEKIKAMAQALILDTKPVIEYVGGSGYEAFRSAAAEEFRMSSPAAKTEFRLPAGYNSAATITPLEDANHFMIAGYLPDTGYDYSGKMNVLGRVLSSGYILPVMRGTYGAYGANVSFDNTGMICGVAGLADIDLALEVWQGMGDYLRSLDMTQKELDAMIVPIVKEFDEYYNDSDYGAQMALSGKTAADIQKARVEMLDTTVEDLRGYADLVDAMVAQNRVFAVLGKTAADEADFSFAYYANAETLEITPRLQKNPPAYLSGRTDTVFAPDAPLTRAEAAVMIARLNGDQRLPEGTAGFSDVEQGDWFASAAAALAEKGVLSGDTEGTFRPEEAITRAEFAALLSKFIYGGSDDPLPVFPDVSPQEWFYEPMAEMYLAGYLTGDADGSLRPADPITRAEAVCIINRMTGRTASADVPNPFADIAGHWAYEEILAAAR